MPSQDIKDYYNATKDREIRNDLTYAVSLVGEPKVAIDCGCGAGADIDYLSASGFKVHGFDIEDEAISRCKKRFNKNSNVILTKSDFSSYQYPGASLVIADASLFFCPETEFDSVWNKIYECLHPNGIFCGSFLGPEDTMAEPINNNSTFWPETSVFGEQEVKDLFKHYDLCRFTEHKTSGKTPQSIPHDWHIYSVVARKKNSDSNGT